MVGDGLRMGEALEAKLIDMGSSGETGLDDGLFADLQALRDRVGFLVAQRLSLFQCGEGCN